jgi:hypothetical protein
MMLSSPKEADINDFANRTSRLLPSTAESIKHAKETLSSLLLTLSGNLDLNTTGCSPVFATRFLV